MIPAHVWPRWEVSDIGAFSDTPLPQAAALPEQRPCGPTATATETSAITDLFQTEPFRRWTPHLAQQIGAALADAAGSLRPGRLDAGAAAAPALSVNRRIRTARGITTLRGVRPSDTVLGPEGPIDDQARILAFEDQTGRPAAILVNAMAHPVYEMCIPQVSPGGEERYGRSSCTHASTDGFSRRLTSAQMACYIYAVRGRATCR